MESCSAADRAALGRIRTALNAHILGYRDQRKRALRALEALDGLEKSALEEVAVIDVMLDATNPYRKRNTTASAPDVEGTQRS